DWPTVAPIFLHLLERQVTSAKQPADSTRWPSGAGQERPSVTGRFAEAHDVGQMRSKSNQQRPPGAEGGNLSLENRARDRMTPSGESCARVRPRGVPSSLVARGASVATTRSKGTSGNERLRLQSILAAQGNPT